MPGQNLDSQLQPGLKLENMAPQITQNLSHTQLMAEVDENSSEDSAVGAPGAQRTIRDVSYKEWIGIFILCFVNLINYMDRYTLAGILPDVQDYYKIGDDKGGLLQTSFVLSYMVFAPLFGYLGDRYSRKAIMACGVFLWSVTTLLGSFMDNFGMFIMFRALVGIGEASYSTIAPTIISDLFVHDIRSKMLALFYFAIPVGSGMGYIVGSTTANALGSWQWALRVTPALGLIAVVLIFFVLEDPVRGHSEGSGHLQATSWKEDIRELFKNGSFIFSTAGFTCVAFVAGALAWWGPKVIHMGIALQPGGGDVSDKEVAYKFGVIAMIAGLAGVPAGSFLAQRLRANHPKIDPHLCAAGLLISSPLVFFALVSASHSSTSCYLLVLLAQFFLNLNWSLVADILLYVVLPTRRSMAEGLQLLFSHALGDAGSPYLIGVISESLKVSLVHHPISLSSNSSSSLPLALLDDSSPVAAASPLGFKSRETQETEFHALQYALFITCFVEVLGGVFFLLNSFFIERDRQRVDKAVKASTEPIHITATEAERRPLTS